MTNDTENHFSASLLSRFSRVTTGAMVGPFSPTLPKDGSLKQLPRHLLLGVARHVRHDDVSPLRVEVGLDILQKELGGLNGLVVIDFLVHADDEHGA